MQLGCFSLSLAVKEIAASRRFYEALGFEVIGGQEEENWLVLEHDGVKIGLFKDMLEKNLLCFNPDDVRGVQRVLKDKGIKFDKEADENATGPGHAILSDPDGNTVLLDQP